MIDILLTFVHLTDTHIHPDPNFTQEHAPHGTQAGARALVSAVNALPFTPDFVLHTGDVTYDPIDGAYHAARAIFADLSAPIYYLSGNHDDPAALQSVLLERAPITPFDQTFTHNGVRVILLDSLRPTSTGDRVRGRVSAEQLNWLHDQCAADDLPLVIGVHHNVLPIGGGFWDDYMSMENGLDLHAALVPYRERVRGVFFGHVHQATATVRDGILYASALSSWYQLLAHPRQSDIRADRGAPPGFSVVMITRDQTFIRRHTFAVNADD